MGTNYYWREGGVDDVHVGKASAGWCFQLHVYPDPTPHPVLGAVADLGDWEAVWASRPGEIVDEYDNTVTPATMCAIITERRRPVGLVGRVGARPTPAWYEENGAEPGPNGLLRSRVGAGTCVGHGAGTWDLCAGEFS